MRRLSGVATALIFLATGAAGACRTSRSTPPSAAIDASPVSPTTTEAVEIVPGPGQTRVTGTVTTASMTGAQVPPLPTPLIITVPNRGVGGLRMTAAIVSGKRSTIVWNAGQPLPLNGRGGLDLSPARVDLSPGSLRWHLDGAAHTLTPARYSFGAPVAVGESGLAAPVDQVDFTADGQTAFTTSGDAGVTLPPRPLHVTGPGSVELAGALTVQSDRATTEATTARFGEGAYDLTATPEGDGWRIDALVQGPRTSSN